MFSPLSALKAIYGAKINGYHYSFSAIFFSFSRVNNMVK